MDKKKRNFIVFYKCSTTYKSQIQGYFAMTCEGFLTIKKINPCILEIHEEAVDIIITGFNEISQEDYNEWLEQ